VISVHTSPLAALGGRDTGGMNVYVRELSRELGSRGYVIDVFTRWSSEEAPETQPFGPNARVINIGRRKHGRKAEIVPPRVRAQPRVASRGRGYDLVAALLDVRHVGRAWASWRTARRPFHIGQVSRARNSERPPAHRSRARDRARPTASCSEPHEKHLLCRVQAPGGASHGAVRRRSTFHPMDQGSRGAPGAAQRERIILCVGRIGRWRIDI
jgi:D-inositol-3-phosphate glycosyltransferase